jgi:hypothetical protein
LPRSKWATTNNFLNHLIQKNPLEFSSGFFRYSFKLTINNRHLALEFDDHGIYLCLDQCGGAGEVHRFLGLPQMCLHLGYRVNDGYHDGVAKLFFLELPFYFPTIYKDHI